MDPSQIQLLLDKMDAKADHLIQVTRDANAATKDLRTATREARKLLETNFAQILHTACLAAIHEMRTQVEQSIETVDKKLYVHFTTVADSMLTHLMQLPTKALAEIFADRKLGQEVLEQSRDSRIHPLSSNPDVEVITSTFTIGR